MRQIPTRAWVLACLSGVLELLPFPIAGPAPVWRTIFVWFALTPLLVAILSFRRDGRPLFPWQSMIVALPAGMIWYTGNCYWIYSVMHQYGNIDVWAAALIQLGFALAGGCYHMLFAAAVSLMWRLTKRRGVALATAPFFWVAQEFARARITQFPWDQIGVAQVDNFLLTRLAPLGGAYLMSWVIVAVSAALAGGFLLDSVRARRSALIGGAIAMCALQSGVLLSPVQEPTTATAVLLQFNLPIRGNEAWTTDEYERNIADFSRLSLRDCTAFVHGIQHESTPVITPDCTASNGHIDLIAWPESPAPFEESDPRFLPWLEALARRTDATVIAQNDAAIADPNVSNGVAMYNSAAFIQPDGTFGGRYNKVHLVPFGEYVPYANVFSFAKPLTAEVSDFSKGTTRNVFRGGGHVVGTFICYESTFANEVRHFVINGAQVLVNVSDDGWYGDTSAPWQHLQMARLRAIENHRWVLRSTNTGVTAAIDPQGRVTQSVPRHMRTSLAAQFGYRDDVTFYTRHGDWFAWLCVMVSVLSLAGAGIYRRAL